MIPCYTRVISERFRDQLSIIKRYRNGLFTLRLLTPTTLVWFCFVRQIAIIVCDVLALWLLSVERLSRAHTHRSFLTRTKSCVRSSNMVKIFGIYPETSVSSSTISTCRLKKIKVTEFCKPVCVCVCVQ